MFKYILFIDRCFIHLSQIGVEMFTVFSSIGVAQGVLFGLSMGTGSSLRVVTIWLVLMRDEFHTPKSPHHQRSGHFLKDPPLFPIKKVLQRFIGHLVFFYAFSPMETIFHFIVSVIDMYLTVISPDVK